jgi:glycosyltransferase involved in cell wall biosynthesis
VTALDGDRDGLPTVLLEAMATGTPVIATPVTGIPEVVIDGETGLVVPESDPYALANAIERLLGDPTLGARLARAARALVEEQFDVRRQAAALGALRLGRRCEAVSA